MSRLIPSLETFAKVSKNHRQKDSSLSYEFCRARLQLLLACRLLGLACYITAKIIWFILLPFHRLKNRYIVRYFQWWTWLKSSSEVPIPTHFGLDYEDLHLRTPDGVTLRSYLLSQRKDVGHHQAGRVGTAMDENQTDEEVSNNMCAVIYFVLVLLFLVQFSATRPTVLMFHGMGKPWTSYTSRQGVLY